MQNLFVLMNLIVQLDLIAGRFQTEQTISEQNAVDLLKFTYTCSL